MLMEARKMKIELGSLSCLSVGQDGGEDDDETEAELVPCFMEALHVFETMRVFVYGHDITEIHFSLVWFYRLGSPCKDNDGCDITDKFVDMSLPMQFYHRASSRLCCYINVSHDPKCKKLLPDPLSYPLTQPKYTLVIELRDVLIHPDWTFKGWRFKKRPGVDRFLKKVAAPMFEIVIFTSDDGSVAFPVLDQLDPKGFITYRLARDVACQLEGHCVKDLRYLNRDLSRVIVVDCNKDSVRLQPRNLLLLSPWKGNDNDQTLDNLANFLRKIASEQVEDVRDVLSFYSQYKEPLQELKNIIHFQRKSYQDKEQIKENTSVSEIEDCFKRFVKRDDIDIILINQNVAEMIRHVIDSHTQPLPAILEIPSKDHPYDASKDSILRRARGMFNPEDLK
uniref:FCP1 homology domain-containing protein n=1 Tax=Timema bartmani TaxID=61472 RepID=A0A7R9I0B3_9NEOP|nr:unnamed protein product [Timema bartmani]